MKKREELNYLEDLVADIIDSYKEAWNETNKDSIIDYIVTVTKHKVPPSDRKNSKSKKPVVDIAYMRLERILYDKEGKEKSRVLVFNFAREFKSMQDKLDPQASYLLDMYRNLIAKCFVGGIEYAEFLSTMKEYNDNKNETTDNILGEVHQGNIRGI